MDTPTPYVPPDDVIQTTLGAVREVGHGEVILTTPPSKCNKWMTVGMLDNWEDNVVLWWRPVHERTVTIELPMSVVQRLRVGHFDYWDVATCRSVLKAARACDA